MLQTPELQTPGKRFPRSAEACVRPCRDISHRKMSCRMTRASIVVVGFVRDSPCMPWHNALWLPLSFCPGLSAFQLRSFGAYGAFGLWLGRVHKPEKHAVLSVFSLLSVLSCPMLGAKSLHDPHACDSSNSAVVLPDSAIACSRSALVTAAHLSAWYKIDRSPCRAPAKGPGFESSGFESSAACS